MCHSLPGMSCKTTQMKEESLLWREHSRALSLGCSTNSSFLPCSLPAPVLAAQRSHTALSSVTWTDLSHPLWFCSSCFSPYMHSIILPCLAQLQGTTNETPCNVNQARGKPARLTRLWITVAWSWVKNSGGKKTPVIIFFPSKLHSSSGLNIFLLLSFPAPKLAHPSLESIWMQRFWWICCHSNHFSSLISLTGFPDLFLPLNYHSVLHSQHTVF